MSEISELLEKDVNRHGELHLDAVKTKMLIKWVLTLEEKIEKYECLGLKVDEVFSDIIKAVRD